MAGAPRGPWNTHHQGITSFKKLLTLGKFRGGVFCIMPVVLAITHRTSHNNLILPNFNIWLNGSEGSKLDSATPNEMTPL